MPAFVAWASRWDCRSYFRTVCPRDVNLKSVQAGSLFSLGYGGLGRGGDAVGMFGLDILQVKAG